MKVLVYDGWSKVKVPITKHEVDLKRLQIVKQAKVLKNKEEPNGKAAEVADDAMDIDLGAISSTSSSINDENSDSEWPYFVHEYDVVITTYQTLRSDLYVAHPGPDRPRRTTVVYERPRSPLVMVEWKRVVMDEVQMVGGGKAE